MIQRLPYFFPVLLLLFLLIADKFFALPWVVLNTFPYKKIERSYYESKADLTQVFREKVAKEPNSRFGVVLGSSRSGEFDSQLFEKFLPGTRTFNYSAPLAPPSYFYFWLKELHELGLPISYVILEIDPILASKNSIKYSLESSYSPSFVLQNTNWFGTGGFAISETETYFLKKLFALYRYPVDIKNIIANNSEVKAGFLEMTIPGYKGKDQKQRLRETILSANRQKLGAFPNELQFTNNSFFLERDSEMIFNLYLKNQPSSETQKFFLRKILLFLQERQIPTVLYFPVSAEPLTRLMEASPVVQGFEIYVQTLLSEIPQENRWVLRPGLDPRWSCRDFFDSVHLSGKCFENILPLVVDPLRSKL